MQSKISRRKFIKTGAAGSAAFAFVPSVLSASLANSAKLGVNKNRMNGITPVSVIDNACLLAFSSQELSQKSQNAISTDIHLRDTPGNKGRLAVLLPPNNEKIYELIEIVKENKDTSYLQEKRAIIFGWVAINSVENNINQIIRDASDNEFAEIRRHQDALLVNGFSINYNTSAASNEDMEALLHSMLTRTITRIHTLKPDSDDGMNWVNRMTEWRKQNAENMRAFAKAIITPDEIKAGKDFYNENDRIIEYSIRLQNGKLAKSEEVYSIIQTEINSSQYGKSLSEAVKNIMSVDEYFNGKMSLIELKSLLTV